MHSRVTDFLDISIHVSFLLLFALALYMFTVCLPANVGLRCIAMLMCGFSSVVVVSSVVVPSVVVEQMGGYA